MTRIAVLALLLSLFSCSGNSPPPSSCSGWCNFAKNTFTPLGDTFQIGTNPILGYVTKPSGPLRQGQTITLNYSISGDGPYTIVDQSDVPPASITLFIWEKGDNLSGTDQYAYYRWWCPARVALHPFPNQVLSCVIDGQWTSVAGAPASLGSPTDITQPAGGFAQALRNPQGVGFTFGGANFFGHGVADGNTTFTINSFTVN